MAHVATVESDASLVAPMKPLLARFRSLFGAALQIRQPPFVSPFSALIIDISAGLFANSGRL
jgi:hypothetical protein